MFSKPWIGWRMVVGGLGIMSGVELSDIGLSEYGDDAPPSEEALSCLLLLPR
jgi:hypothetical protein